MLRNILLLFLCLLSGLSSANVFIGSASSESKILSQNAAVYDLSTRLSEYVIFLMGNDSVRTFSDPPLHGTKVHVTKRGQQYIGRASLDEIELTTNARTQSIKLKKQIDSLVLKLGTLSSKRDKQRAINILLSAIDQYQRYLVILAAYDKKHDETLPVKLSKLHRDLARSLSPQRSIDDALTTLVKSLSLTKTNNLFIYAPTKSNSENVTAISGTIKDSLRHAVGASRSSDSIMRADHYLTGSYQLVNKNILVIYHLRDRYHNTLNTATALFTSAKTERNSITRGNNLSRSLYRGLVRVNTASASSPRQKNYSQKSFRVDIRTEQGNRNLYYRLGSTGKLFVKMTTPGYFYIVGHISKGKEQYSYLLQLSNQRGNRRFISRVDTNNIHQWINLGEFDIDPPLGTEALQVVASTQSPMALLPRATYDVSSGLYLIGNDPEKNIETTRGLVRIAIDKAQSSTKKTSNEAPLFSEAVLHFTTLPNN